MASNSLGSKTKHGKPTGSREAVEKSTSTAIGKHFLDSRTPKQQRITARINRGKASEICADWLASLPLGETHDGHEGALQQETFADINEVTSERIRLEACRSHSQPAHKDGQSVEKGPDAEADEYAHALAWARRCVLEQQQQAAVPGWVAGGSLSRLPTGYTVEISTSEKLVELRNFVEDVVDDLCRTDTSPNPERLKGLDA